MPLVYPNMQMSEVVEEHPSLIPVINRFGIRLGLGDKSVKTICEEYKLDTDFLLTVINTFLNEEYFPEKKLQTFHTSQIIDYATKSENNTFIICTEMGVFYELHQKNPEKKFYSVGHRQFCPNMKMVRLEGVKEALETMQPEVNLDEEMRQKAALPLEKMLKLAAQ